MAVDTESAVGQVRLLTADLDEANPVLADNLIKGYLSLNDDNVHRAAADVLDAIATTEVLLAKKIRTQDLSTDGPAVAAELRAQAARLRARADSSESSWFEVIPFGCTSPVEGAEYKL